MTAKQIEAALKLATTSQLASALASRNENSGRKATCHPEQPDPDCPRCQQRIYRRGRREKGLN